MSIQLLKFGGTSLGDVELIKNAAKIVSEYISRSKKVVVVVSAMSGMTNRILNLCREISQNDIVEKGLEYDAALSTGESLSASLFALALQDMGINARSIQGWQVVVRSTNIPNSALITNVETKLITDLIKENIVPVVTGFQALSGENRVTTIGRGGSDTSAAAIAAALDAESCDIYTDVEGIYTCDPRLIDNAKIIEKISFEEILELSSGGAKVLHPRSIEICMRYNIPLRLFSSFTKKSGTVIMKNINEIKKISGIAYLKDMHIVRIKKSFYYTDLIKDLASSGISIYQVLRFNSDEISVICKLDIINSLRKFLEQRRIFFDETPNISSITIVGSGIMNNLELVASIINLLEENHANIIDIINSEIKITIILQAANTEKLVQLLHKDLLES
ncbi:MAG: aspartate kinase [Rickettsiaceae bacterium]|nr:aspartate kinase [Rickettsiaceae bacterium]